MPYFEKIAGERIYLSPIDPEDAALFTRWINDVEVARWYDCVSRVQTLSAEQAYLERKALNTEQHSFAIVLRDGNRLLGCISFLHTSLLHRIATIGIYIGEAEDRSKGYGAEAIRLLVDYGFRWLGLRNIDLTAFSGNARAVRCYEKVGFKEYGRRHEAFYTDGHWQDKVHMQLLAKDWFSTHSQ